MVFVEQKICDTRGEEGGEREVETRPVDIQMPGSLFAEKYNGDGYQPSTHQGGIRKSRLGVNLGNLLRRTDVKNTTHDTPDLTLFEQEDCKISLETGRHHQDQDREGNKKDTYSTTTRSSHKARLRLNTFQTQSPLMPPKLWLTRVSSGFFALERDCCCSPNVWRAALSA